jgi:transposase
MPIGIVSDSDFEKEMDRGEASPVPELKPAQIIDLPSKGRSEGDNNVPQFIRDVIVDEKVSNGRSSALEFAKMFDVSSSSVSAYSNGANSTASYNRPSKNTNSKLKEAKLRVATRARKKLNLAIENITEDKLIEASLKDLALVAKSMSGVIKDMEPPANPADSGLTVNGPSIIMYNPGFSKESNFDQVEVNE